MTTFNSEFDMKTCFSGRLYGLQVKKYEWRRTVVEYHCSKAEAKWLGHIAFKRTSILMEAVQ